MSLLQSSGARRRPQFHRLRVAGVERLTDRAVAVSFDVPRELQDAFDFQPGQYLTLRAEIDGVQVRRSYSICSTRADAAETGRVRVAANEVPGGAMSTWLNRVVRQGDEVEVLAPMGDFVSPGEPGRDRRVVAVAAGSGITPVISIVGSVLADEPGTRVALVYGNRSRSHAMFHAELAALAGRYVDRFVLHEVLSRPDLADSAATGAGPTDAGPPAGRIDGPRLTQILQGTGWLPEEVDAWLLCGPPGLVETVRAVLTAAGVDPSRVRHEEFVQQRA